MNDLDHLFRQEAGLSPNKNNENNPFSEPRNGIRPVSPSSLNASTGNNLPGAPSGPSSKKKTLTLNQLIYEKAINSYTSNNTTTFTSSTDELNQRSSRQTNELEWYNVDNTVVLPSSNPSIMGVDATLSESFTLFPPPKDTNSKENSAIVAPKNNFSASNTTKRLPLHPNHAENRSATTSTSTTIASKNSILFSNEVMPPTIGSSSDPGNGKTKKNVTNSSRKVSASASEVSSLGTDNESSPRNSLSNDSFSVFKKSPSPSSRTDHSYPSAFGNLYPSDSLPPSLNSTTGATYTQYADRIEGRIFMRHITGFFIKQWKERYVSLNISKGFIRIWNDKMAMLRGEECIQQIQFSTTMALSPMKVATSTGNPPRIFYRHIADVKDILPSNLLSRGTSSTNVNSISALHIANATKHGSRIFKFGCSNQKDFEVWTKALRSSIDTLIHLEKTIIATHDALDIGNRMNGTDLMKLALQSPTTHPTSTSSTTKSNGNYRDNLLHPSESNDNDNHFIDTNEVSHRSNTTVRSSGTIPLYPPPSASDTLKFYIQLLDRSPVDITLLRSATVHDACLRIRELIHLEADADHSLYLRSQDTLNRDNFTILPDILAVENVEKMIRKDNFSLVYKRRICLPPKRSGNDETNNHHHSKVIVPVWDNDFFTNPFHFTVNHDPCLPQNSLSIPSSESSSEAPSVSTVPDAAQTEADTAASVNQGALHIEYADAVYNVTNGNYFLSLEQSLILAGLQLVTLTVNLSFGRATTTAESTDSKSLPLSNLLRFYKQNLATILSTDSTNEFYAHQATTSGDDIGTVLTNYHNKAKGYTNNSILEAQKLYVKAVRSLPEYGSNFYFGELARHLAPENLGSGSRSADITPPWAENITTLTAHPTHPPDKLSVIIGMNHRGIFIRPCSNHTNSLSTISSRLSYTKYRCGWTLHPIHFIEVWGVKKTRPCFTYRVRENQLVNIEITSSQFKEMAAGLHMVVFALMAQREGKVRIRSREIISVPLAHLTKEKNKEAKEKAVSDLPTGWIEIMDPSTGSIVYWHTVSKRTVFTRPTVTDTDYSITSPPREEY